MANKIKKCEKYILILKTTKTKKSKINTKNHSELVCPWGTKMGELISKMCHL